MERALAPSGVGALLRGKAGENVKLTNLKWECFCLEYAKTANAADAYRKAYKSKSNNQVLSQSASRLLKNEKIQARLAELHEEMASEKIAGAREIQERLTAILRMAQQEEQIVVEGCGDGVSEARIVKRKPQLKDAIKAGEVLAKMQGAFDSSVKVNVVVPVIGGDDELED